MLWGGAGCVQGRQQIFRFKEAQKIKEGLGVLFKDPSTLFLSSYQVKHKYILIFTLRFWVCFFNRFCTFVSLCTAFLDGIMF
jgi:hypothetical protein